MNTVNFPIYISKLDNCFSTSFCSDVDQLEGRKVKQKNIWKKTTERTII